jgi:pimeloyl-ACP methyl ester carboxylesterase
MNSQKHTPPLLFLHGAFGGPEIWTRFVAPWFADRGHRVAVPCLAEPTSPEPRLRDYIRAARASADALGEKPVVIAHSLGGLVAQHLAAEGRVSGMVLVASPGPFGLVPSVLHLGKAPDVLAALMLVQAGLGALLDRDLVRRALFTEETPDSWIDAVAVPPQREPLAVLLDGMGWDLPLWPLARRVPTFAVLGDRDAFVPQADLWAIAAAYGAETEVLAGRGHGLPLDPTWKSLAWRINAWLEERPAASRLPFAFPWLGPAAWTFGATGQAG